MARVSTYLNFTNSTEQAFLIYRSVFGGEFLSPIQRFGDIPPSPDQPPMPDGVKSLVLHVTLAILSGHVLAGTDAPALMGFSLVQGNNVHLNLEPDTRAETKKLFDVLATGGTVDMPLGEMAWGGYFGSLTDKFGIKWMFNCESQD
jgi:PhnB protein